jgi:hypothetical protein
MPPANDLSIFDDPTDFTQAGAGLEQDAEWKSDDEQESPGGLVYKKKPPHPDDMLNGEVLRTNEALATNARADSFYLVYSPRSKLVKIGITLLSYEECFGKYSKLYGSLESFHFLKIENGNLQRLFRSLLYIQVITTSSSSTRYDARASGAGGVPVLPRDSDV